MKHKHYDCIIAFANGEQIQCYDKTENEWQDIKFPSWYDECKYRVKHKHQDYIDAFERGEQIQYFDPLIDDWMNANCPSWMNCIQYRIKPEPTKVSISKNRDVDKTGSMTYSFNCTTYEQIKNDIDDILTYFDFYHVQTTMRLLGWSWWNTNGTPTIKDLRKQARNLLETAAKNVLIEEYDGEYTTSCGGFCAVARVYENDNKVYLKLSFEIESWDNFD